MTISLRITENIEKIGVLIQNTFTFIGFVLSTATVMLLLILIFGLPALLSFGWMKIDEWFDIRWQKKNNK